MAISVVQSAIAQGNYPTATATTAGMTTTTGNLVILDNSYNGAFSSNTDSVGNTPWLTAIAEINTTENSTSGRETYFNQITGNATHTFTLTLTSALIPTICAIEVTGQATSSPLDKVQSDAVTSGSTTITGSNTATTTQADELLHGFGFDSFLTTTKTFAISAPWTLDKTLGDISAPNFREGLISASQVVSATGAYNFVFTKTSANDKNGIGISTWKAAAGGSSIKTVDGLAYASVKTINGLAIASIKTRDGLA